MDKPEVKIKKNIKEDVVTVNGKVYATFQNNPSGAEIYKQGLCDGINSIVDKDKPTFQTIDVIIDALIQARKKLLFLNVGNNHWNEIKNIERVLKKMNVDLNNNLSVEDKMSNPNTAEEIKMSFNSSPYPNSKYFLHHYSLVDYILETNDPKEEIKRVTANTKKRIEISKNSTGSTTVSHC